jgi:hypothetical protein
MTSPAMMRVSTSTALLLALLTAGCQRRWSYENQPLDRPVRLAALRPPGTAELADGRCYQVYGVRLLRPVSFRDAFEGKAPEPVDVEVRDPGSRVSRIDFKGYGGGACGLTTGPVPAYARRDVGAALVRAGVALPALRVFDEDPEYARELVRLLPSYDTHAERSRPALAGDAEVVKLAELLLDRHPEATAAALYLLERAGDARFVPLAAARLERLAAEGITGPRVAPARRRSEVSRMVGLLYRREPAAAERAARLLFHVYDPAEPSEQASIAGTLVLRGDWSPYDELVRRLTDPSFPAGYRESLAPSLAGALNFPFRRGTDPAGFARWYRHVRPRLQVHKSWVAFGPGTNDAYRASMRPYAKDARRAG